MTTQPVAGNQSYTSVVDLAAQLPSLNVGGGLNVGGDLTVGGSINPGTFTNRVAALTATAATRQVTAAESGSTFAITKVAVALNFDLPTPALGLNYTFVQANPAVGGSTVLIRSTTDGTTLVATMGGNLGAGVANELVGDAAMTTLVNSITFAATSVAGDNVTVRCVSTNVAANTLTWLVSGFASATGQLT
jgi:hypothetical protein